MGDNNSSRGCGSYWIPALIIGVFAALSSMALAMGLIRFHSAEEHTIAATGSASRDFESDLIIWRGNFCEHADTTKQAYSWIERDAAVVRSYLKQNGVDESEMVFSSVNISLVTRDIYDDNGNYTGYINDGYDLSQDITVTSSDVDKIETISRDISSLLESGIAFTSYSPEYYCTTLNEVKLELIDEATRNARDRINIMAGGAGAEYGRLVNSSLGVFQITARNSGTDSYTYDGAFDTSSRFKTASITVRLEYALK